MFVINLHTKSDNVYELLHVLSAILQNMGG